MTKDDLVELTDQTDQREMSRVVLAVPVRFNVWNNSELGRLKRRYAFASSAASLADQDVIWQSVQEAEMADFIRPLLPVLQHLDRKLDLILQTLGQQKSAQEHRYQGEVTNISGSGLRLVTTAKVPADTLLEMSLQLPALPTGVDMVAQAVRVGASGDPRFPVEVGANYVVLHELDRERIIRYVFEVQRSDLKRRAAARDGLPEEGW